MVEPPGVPKSWAIENILGDVDREQADPPAAQLPGDSEGRRRPRRPGENGPESRSHNHLASSSMMAPILYPVPLGPTYVNTKRGKGVKTRMEAISRQTFLGRQCHRRRSTSSLCSPPAPGSRRPKREIGGPGREQHWPRLLWPRRRNRLGTQPVLGEDSRCAPRHFPVRWDKWSHRVPACPWTNIPSRPRWDE